MVNGVPPRVIGEKRGKNHAVIWYDTCHPPRSHFLPRSRRNFLTGEYEPPPSPLPLTVLPKPGVRLGMSVPSWGGRCGVAEYSRYLMESVRKLGYQVEVLGGQQGALVGQAREKGLNVIHFQHEYSLWHPVALREQTALLAKAGVKTVVTIHAFGNIPDHNAVLRNHFSAFVVHSEQVGRELEAHGFKSGKIAVIPMGVNLYSLPQRGEVRAELGIGDEPVLGFFGFFSPQKGIIELGEAVARLRMLVPGLRCHLFSSVAVNGGSRQYRQQVKETFDRKGLWEGVVLSEEFLPDNKLVRYLHAMDINILPYAEIRARQTSAAVRMLMAAMRPIIVTETAPFSDLSREVYKIPANTPDMIVNAVTDVLGDRALQARLASAMQDYAHENSWERVASRHISLYERL